MTARMLSVIQLCVVCSVLYAQNPWINEIHYDNIGIDEMEYVEIIVPTPPNCPTIVVERYNGLNGLSYGATVIDASSGLVLSGSGSGCMPDVQGFYRVLGIEYPSNGLQNGPDGIAIQCGTYVQFLTYGGSFTAIDGIAFGLTGSDIGIVESGSADIIYSAQLQGTGSVYSHFSWVIDTTTHCATNQSQVIIEPSCTLMLGNASISCQSFTEGVADSVSVTVPYTGIAADDVLLVSVNGMSVANLGDDPTSVPDGTITFPAIEGSNFIVAFENDCNTQMVTGTISLITCKPYAKLKGDLFFEQSIDGVILKSPDGSCFRLSVSDTGLISTEMVPCPEN